MSRKGRRYSDEKKLNIKKVFAVLIAIVVLVLFAIGIKKMINVEPNSKISNETYYAAFEDNKYGVINSKGEIIIAPGYEELIIVPDQNKDVFICTYDIDYTQGTYKTKVLNSKNEEIYTEYDKVEALSNYDNNNNISYNNSVLKVEKDGKYGLITIDGKQIVNCQYDKIYSLIGNENSIVVEKDGKVGVIDNNGRMVVEEKYKEIKKLSDNYKSGYIVVSEDNSYGTVDCANNTILECKYAEIKPIYDNGIYVVKGTTGYNAVDKAGTVLTKKEYQDIKDVKLDEIIVKENDKYGVIKTTGEQVVPCSYEDISFISTNNFIVKNNGKYGIIGSNNEYVIDNKYQYINYVEDADIIEVSEDGITSNVLNNKFETKLTGIIAEINTQKGYLKIRENQDYKYYNFKFEEKTNTEIYSNNNIFLSKKDNKYGFVDKDGNVVVDYIYDDATELNNLGFAAVNQNGKWGSINQNGNVVANIESDLTSNTIINFIGKWHLMKDTNINCYTK